uniref:Uncharacterized protein n=1 Tax=Timema shepardi TaxID=629360 RepID=A0A7R9AWP1_TIMSH|nr:unnamed protein product [Timema shepardi]
MSMYNLMAVSVIEVGTHQLLRYHQVTASSDATGLKCTAWRGWRLRKGFYVESKASTERGGLEVYKGQLAKCTCESGKGKETQDGRQGQMCSVPLTSPDTSLIEKPPPVHPTEIRTSISPSSAVELQYDKRVSQLRHRGGITILAKVKAGEQMGCHICAEIRTSTTTEEGCEPGSYTNRAAAAISDNSANIREQRVLRGQHNEPSDR